MDAIVTAGGIPRIDDPLYSYTQGGFKVLLELAGKPMIQWVLEAVSGSAHVERLFVIGLPAPLPATFTKPVTFLTSKGNLLENIRAAAGEVLKVNPGTEQVLLVSGDVPAVTTAMIDWMIAQAAQSKEDIYYPVIERAAMERRFPGANRTYLKLKDRVVCGGDVMVINPALAADHHPLWKQIVAARKNPLKQASLLGANLLFGLLLGRLTLDKAATQVSRRLAIRGRAVLCPYPEIGMDVDKPSQLELLRKDLAARVQ